MKYKASNLEKLSLKSTIISFAIIILTFTYMFIDGQNCWFTTGNDFIHVSEAYPIVSMISTISAIIASFSFFIFEFLFEKREKMNARYMRRALKEF